MPEANWFESRGDSLFLRAGIVGGFSLGGRDVSNGLEKPAIVEPVLRSLMPKIMMRLQVVIAVFVSAHW